MLKNDAIALSQKLISFDTVNPPGNEAETALYLGNLLSENGFAVEYTVFEENRLHLIAEKGIKPNALPIVLSGHLDVVPFGKKEWSVDPLGGEIIDGKLYGRGSSDMKSGVAAIVIAAIEVFEETSPRDGVRLVITAGEELGCQGVQQLVETSGNLGKAKAVIVAEPTANLPVIGHKGGLYLNVITLGVTAHSSMPELGDNAIYKAARLISKVEAFKFNCQKDDLLGFPTINVGKIKGGLNLNSVPDFAEFTIDVRSTTKIDHEDILNRLKQMFNDEAKIEVLVNRLPVSTNEKEEFVQQVYDVCKLDRTSREYPKSLPYLTDGSVLQSYYKGAPTIILGPGQPEMAHQTNEFCYIRNIIEAVEIYKTIILK